MAPRESQSGSGEREWSMMGERIGDGGEERGRSRDCGVE